MSNDKIIKFVQSVENYQSNHYGTYNRNNLVEAYLNLPIEFKKQIEPKSTRNLYRGADGFGFNKVAISFSRSKDYAKFFGAYVFPFSVVEKNEGLIDTAKLGKVLGSMRIPNEIGDDEGEVIVINPIFKKGIESKIENYRFDSGGMTYRQYVDTQFNENEDKYLPSGYLGEFEIKKADKSKYPILIAEKNDLEYRIENKDSSFVVVFDGDKWVAYADNKAIEVAPTYQKRGIGLDLVRIVKERNPNHRFGSMTPEGFNLMGKYYDTYIANNPDIRYDEGGRVEHLISEGIVDLKMYDTTPEHAKEYGLDSVNPLYVQSIYISENQRLKGIGKQVLAYIEKYAIENGHDLVFGHINQKAEPSVDVIKSMLVKSGFNTCEGNNDFYRIIGISDIRYNDGGEVNSNSFMKWYVQWYKGIFDKMNIVFSLPSVIAPFKEENVVVLDVFEKINQNIDAKPYLKEIVEKADEYGVVIYLEPTPRHNRFQYNLEKKKKITREYLIEYYKRFGFQLAPNKQFMKRLPKSNPDIRYDDGGYIDPFTNKKIKKIYVSIAIRSEIEKTGFGEYQIDTIDEKVFIELQQRKLTNLLGVSASSYNISDWFVSRQCLVVMDVQKFINENNAEQIKYEDADYLVSDGLEIFFRLFNRKERDENAYYEVLNNIFKHIPKEFNIVANVSSDKHINSLLYYIAQISDVYYSGKFVRWLSKENRISKINDFYDLLFKYIESNTAKSDYPYYISFSTDDITKARDLINNAFKDAILSSASAYKDESEWLIKNKTLSIPKGSQLFFKLGSYDNLRDKYEEYISKYDLRDIFRIYFVDHKNIDRYQRLISEQKDVIYKAKQKAFVENVDKKIANALDKIENEIIESYERQVQSQMFENYGSDKNPFSEPQISILYNEIISKFIELLETAKENAIRYKSKVEFYQAIDLFKNYLREKARSFGDEKSDYITSDGSSVYLSDIVSSLFYSAILYLDYEEILKNIKSYIGEDLYRVYKAEDIRFKKGGTMKKINMDFGKYAFTDKNENPKVANTAKRLQQGKYEENTEQEGDILEILSAWTHASNEQNSKTLKELKPIFDVGKTKYPEIFKPKQGVKLLYRGISNLRKDKDVPKDISTYTLVNFDGSSFYLSNQPFDYKPTRDTQSWTTDFKKAKGFSGDAILVTLVSDDFYFNADFMDSLFAKEKETIHIGKKFEHKVFIALSTGLYNELVREKTIKPKKAIDEINKLKFAEGGTMKKVDKGGITYGKSHDEGGIPVKNASTGQMLEVEGGEGIVNKRSMASDKMVKLNGKEMTICQAVSQLNQIEGGVKFSCDDVEHRQFIEAMALGGELERGIRTEKEHIDTLRKLYENRLTPNQAITEIAKEHIAESPTYYSDLEKNNLNKIAFSESANKLGMSEQSLSELIYDMQGKFFRSRFDTEPIEKPDFEDEDDLTRYAYGGQTKSDCGCSHSPKKYMDGGIFDSGFGSLDSFLGGLEEKNQNKKDAEYSFEVIEYARKLLDKDYKYDLINGLPPKYKVYFENLKEANLYKVGWRFKYGSSRQWAGLCAYNGLVFDKGKTLYLSINFVKHDENWKQNETDTILHEMAHAFVSEFIKTKIPASSFNELDPTDAALEGHGEAFTEVCKALNPNGDCGRFYTKSNLKPSFLPFMYECAFCGVKKYSQNRNFTTICYQCNKPVIVIKND